MKSVVIILDREDVRKLAAILRWGGTGMRLSGDGTDDIIIVKGEPNIIECHHITGPYSMLMQVVFTTTSALDEFLGRLQVFGKTETQVVFSTIMENRSIVL